MPLKNLYVEGKINYIRQHGENRPGNDFDINTVLGCTYKGSSISIDGYAERL